MTSEPEYQSRFFVTYSSVKLPLKLVNEIDASSLANRNTYYHGCFDAEDRLVICQKIVYGEVESEHRYQYNQAGVLIRAEITEDDETRSLHFDETGNTVPG
jgi:hypothetical protein